MLGNPLLAELDLLFNHLRELKGYLVLLQSHKELPNYIFQNTFRHLRKYTGKELSLFLEEGISEHCTTLLKEISTTFDDATLKAIRSGKITVDQNQVKKILMLVTRVQQAEEKLLMLRTNLKFENEQKKKAKKLAKPRLVFTEKGCYHYIDPAKIISILSHGLLSLDSAKLLHQIELDVATYGFQGSNFLSVFDPYSYWKLFLYFQKKNKITKILNFQPLTLEEMQEALAANPNLNLARWAKVNLKILQDVSFFEGDRIQDFKAFPQAMLSLAQDQGQEYMITKFGSRPLFLVINDTAMLFPKHYNPWPFEGLFENRVAAKKISGLLVGWEKYYPLAEEFGKFTGLPVYNKERILMWPK